MAHLTNAHRSLLHRACAMQFSGGTSPYNRSEYRQLEKLRQLRLVRFWTTRSRRWGWNFYTITDRGVAYVESYEAARAKRCTK